jgi:hypothetical protein
LLFNKGHDGLFFTNELYITTHKFFYGLINFHKMFLFKKTADLMELNYRQITSNRPLNNDQFQNGVIDYNFNIGGQLGWIPSRSYFRVALRLKGKFVPPVNGVPQPAALPLISDQVAFSESVCGNLFSNVYFRAGGQDVSSIVNYVPQAQAAKNRLTKSGAWLNTMGKKSFMLEPDFQKRVNSTAADTPAIFDDHVQTVKLGDTNNQADYRFQILAADGVVTGTNTAFQTAGVVVGDQLLVLGAVYTVAVVTDENTLTVSPKPTVDVDTGANGSALKLLREQDGSGRQVVYAMWQPPIGIFDHHNPMGSGEYRIQLNPNAYYKTSCVQSKLPGLSAPADYDIDVLEIQFFAATCKVNIASTGVETLHLMEHQVLTKSITNVMGENLLDFTVPSSTKAISVFVQSGDSGTTTQIPPSLFKTKDASDQKLASIQIAYANTVKPSTRWTSEFTDATNYLTQRYTDTQIESGQFYSPGGCESFADWLKRGPLIHYSFTRDKDDRSTNLQVALQYNGIEANANCFVVAHYSRTAEITINNGFVVSVNTLST